MRRGARRASTALRPAALGLAALAIVAAGAARGAAPDRSLDETLAAHCRARGATSSVRARFVQTRSFTALGEEERSAGVLLYRKPDSLRWEYSEPDRSFTVIRGRRGWAVFPSIRQVRRFELAESRIGGMLSVVGFGACGAAFRESFDVALAPAAGGRPVLWMRPLRAEIAASFTKIELALDPRDHLPRMVLLHETTGDTVRIDLLDLRRDVAVDASLFEFATPKDYSVVP